MIRIIIIIVYLAVTIGIGIWAKSRILGGKEKEYHGNELGLLMCVAVGAGEWMGGTSTTGVAEYGFLHGISGAWYTLANGLGICVLALFFARMFRRLNTVTVPEMIGRYLGQKARTVSSVFMILVLAIVGLSQMMAAGTLGESLPGLRPGVAIPVLGSGVLIYTCLGGMTSVGYTNVVHLVVMYLGVLCAVVLCGAQAGGWTALAGELPASCFSFTAIGSQKISSWLLASVLGACTGQAGLQPILTSRDEKTAVRASFLIAALVAPFGIFTALLGMIARVRFPELGDAKLALPTLLVTLPSWVSGLLLASILAAVLSTAAPIFLSCGTLFARDIYPEIEKKRRDACSGHQKDAGRKCVAADDAEGCRDNRVCPGDAKQALQLRISRLATFLAGAVCILLAVLFKNNATILDIVYFAYSLRGSLFIILLLGLFWKKMSPDGAICAMALTFAVSLFWVLWESITGEYPITGVSETYAALICTTVAAVAVSLAENRK